MPGGRPRLVGWWCYREGDHYQVDHSTGCWLWLGAVKGPGPCFYGKIKRGGKEKSIHRASYEHFRGPIPDGLDIDHLCRQTLCLNPDHLEPVTRGQNVLRGFNPAARRARQTHCKNGHELPEKDRRGRRICRPCRDAYAIAYEGRRSR